MIIPLHLSCQKDHPTLLKESKTNRKKPKNQLNHYTGSEWAKASLSVHKFEGPIPSKRKEHGAAFPFRLAKHFISTYTKENDLVFDPFVGVGTTLESAKLLGRKSIGIDINKKFIKHAKAGPDKLDVKQLEEEKKPKKIHKPKIVCDDSQNLLKHVKKESVDLILTSPPYGNLLRLIRPNFADKMPFNDTKDKSKKINKTVANPPVYSEIEKDIGNLPYKDYLAKLEKIFNLTYQIAKKDSYAIWVVKDYRDMKNKIPYVPLHSDLIPIAQKEKWILWDIVIWDQSERRPLVVLGYPSKNFYANIGHSYILIFKKQ
jgi:DNA modification methylase